MTAPFLVAVQTLVVAAVDDWPAIIQGGGTASVIALLIYGIRLTMTGRLRLEREVAAAEARAVAAETRAEKEEEARHLLQDALTKEIMPAVIESRIQGKRLVEIYEEMGQQQKNLINAFIARMSET